MSCRYLTKTVQTIEEQNGDGEMILTRQVACPACRLGRQLDVNGWAEKCRKSSPDGPCWLWIAEHGELSDPTFDEVWKLASPQI